MRLLILTPELAGSGGGIKTFYRNLLPFLRKRGVNVRLIEGSAFHAEKTSNAIDWDGIRIETLELPRLQKYWLEFSALESMPGLRRHLAAAWAMWEQAQFGTDADVVEATDWGLLFVPPAIERNIPMVVQAHGSVGQIATHDPVRGEEGQSALVQLIERAVMSKATEVQSYSQANAGFWRGETCRNVNMIRPAWSPPTHVRHVEPGDRGLVIGRVQRWKGPATLCRAQALLRERAPRIDWVGRDTPWEARDRPATAHLAEAFPNVWGRTIQNHQPVDQDEVARRQSNALFNLIPSIWDVFNFTAVEAMASGRPTIISTGAGASELVEDGENGFLFTSDDAESLAAAMDRVLTAPPSILEQIGRNGAETVGRQLDPDMIAECRVSTFEGVVAQFTATAHQPIEGWLREICAPGKSGDTARMHFLEHHPLSGIIGHVRDRLVRRIRLP